MSLTLALDVGGTHMRAAVFHEHEIVPIKQRRIRTKGVNESAFTRLLRLIQEIIPPNEIIDRVGIAVPGLIDPHQGMIITTPNIPEWSGMPIVSMIEDELGIPTLMGNDANLAALGEWRYGAGQGHQHLLYLTISTGIGGGIIIDDQLLVGSRGLGAELGHVTILPNGPLCSCGQRGHLEALASGTGIATYVAEQLHVGRTSSLEGTPDTKAIALAANHGDSLAQEAFDRAGTYLGLAIANYLTIFNPTIVILGGGVSLTGDLLINPVRKALSSALFSDEYLQDLVITQAALGDDAGLYGALALALSKK
jgi:glucokinase